MRIHPSSHLCPWVALTAILLVLASACKGGPSSPDANQPYEGTRLQGMSADFRLTDQNGASVALSDFRGKIVALAFLDPKCTDICPLTALHLRKASESLDKDASKVAFLAVNANAKASSISDLSSATRKWGMDALRNWHFLTGNAGDLQAAWSSYGVAAGGEKPDKPGEVQHTPGVIVIDQRGERRWYVSIPLEDTGWKGPTLSALLENHIRQLLSEPK